MKLSDIFLSFFESPVKNKDIFLGLSGKLTVVRMQEDYQEEVFSDKNLVVTQSNFILRDLLFEDSDRISKMTFGNLNLGLTDDLVNIPAPALTNTALVNKTFEKPILKVKTLVGDQPSIEYTCIIEKDEFNGDGNNFITELGLYTETNRLFSVKNRKPIYKDTESSLKFIWTIIFGN